ncbi:MAG: hypothetical protein V1689_10320 [Pseudomonadota bacterium]
MKEESEVESVYEIRQQIGLYKRFGKLIQKYIDMAIEHSQIRIEESKRMKEGRG